MQWTYSQTISPQKWAVVETTHGARMIAIWHEQVSAEGYTAVGEPTTNIVPLWLYADQDGVGGEFLEVPPKEGEPPNALRIDIVGEIEDPSEGE